MKLCILAHICLNFSSSLLYQTSYYLCHIRSYVCAFGVRGGGGSCIFDIVCFMQSCIWLLTSIDSATSEPLETLQPSRFKPPVTLPSQYPTKTLEGPPTLTEPPPVNGKCTCLVHVTHLLAPKICLWTFWFLVTQEC